MGACLVVMETEGSHEQVKKICWKGMGNGKEG